MMTKSFPASFVRGGTSNGLIIDRNDLPENEAEWQPILSSAMGSPDPFGRQLNGIGSGISSTSKICVISKSKREDADVDYTFVQVGIKEGNLDVAGNCGNMSSAVGPVAWDEELIGDRATVASSGDEITLRMYNSNTNKLVHSTFRINGKTGKYEPHGDYSLDGVPGKASKITLSFLDPAGAKTGKALPTGNKIDTLELQDDRTIRASLVDVANPGIFVFASDVGVPGNISSDELGSNSKVMALLENIRQEGTKMMGLDPTIQSVPKIVLISKPEGSAAITDNVNIVCRALSMQQAHKAVPLTLALNLGAACRIPGTLPALTVVGADNKPSITIAHASGKVDVGSIINNDRIESALLHRTARVLMKGDVFYSTQSA
jgi:2-methylaconitate cis-trans-isomerase PrpF